jgi:hypothetical protein
MARLRGAPTFVPAFETPVRDGFLTVAKASADFTIIINYQTLARFRESKGNN